MTLLIADDEPLVRFSLKSMVDELNLGLTVCAEATNGDELVSQALKYRPDLAFVDVRMPGQNGLAAIRRLKKAGLETKWVILSSHAEFDYASEAVQLGVSSYLLKPAGPAQLFETLGPLIRQVDRDRADACARFEQSLIVALQTGADTTAPPVDEAWVGVVRLEAGPQATLADRSGFPSEVLRIVKQGAAGLRCQDLKTAAWIDGADRLVLVAEWDPAVPAAHTAALGWRDSVSGLVRVSAGLQLRLTGLHAEVRGWSALTSTLETLKDQLCLRVLLGTGAWTEWKAARHRLPEPADELVAWARELELCADARDRADFGVLETHLQTAKAQVTTLKPPRGLLEQAQRFLAFRFGMEPLDEMSQSRFQTWLDDLSQRTKTLVPEVRRQADVQYRVVGRVDQYLRDHLADEVRVPELASILGLTPNYLSTVYRQAAGRTISERLAEVRLDRARDLLARPGSQVKEVAAAVGYKSARHFARLYHERFGQTPSGR